MTALLQTTDGDLAITNGRLTTVEGTTEKAQKINNRLGLFRGEWFRDIRIGTPWWERVFDGMRSPDLLVVKRVLRAAILSVPGVVDLRELSVSLVGRELRYEYEAIDDDGQIIEGGGGQPYIIDE